MPCTSVPNPQKSGCLLLRRISVAVLMAFSSVTGLPFSIGVAVSEVLNDCSKKRIPLVQALRNENSAAVPSDTSSQSKPHAGQVAFGWVALWSEFFMSVLILPHWRFILNSFIKKQVYFKR
jgi:hypothetical protein